MARRYLPGAGVALALALLCGPAPAQAQRAEYLGKSLADWAGNLNSQDPVARRSAAFALGKMGSAAAGLLVQLEKVAQGDAVGSVKEAAALAIGEICKGAIRASERPDIVAALTAALADADPLVRRSAAVALGTLGPDAAAAAPALEKAAADLKPAVRQNAAWALGQIKAGGATAVNALRRALRDADPLVVRDAAKAVGQLEASSGHGALQELLDATKKFSDPKNVETRKAALQALVGVVGPDDKVAAVGPLTEALNDKTVKDGDVKYNAALALGNIGGAEASAAVPVLVEAMKQKADLDLRRQAAAVLKNIGPAAVAALNPLRQALRDPDPDLRRNAAVALGGLGKAAEPAYPDLVNMVADHKENEKVRVQSAVALSRMGDVPEARQSAPKLIAVVRDTTNPAEVRLRSLWALRALNQGLKDFPELFDALDLVVREAKTEQNRMLRYDAAFLLGVFKRDQVSKAALDVLLDFLHDDTVQIYVGAKIGSGSGVSEKGSGAGKVVEHGKGDGRVMAVQALRFVGGEKVRTRPDIVAAIRALRNSPDERLSGEVKTLLERLSD